MGLQKEYKVGPSVSKYLHGLLSQAYWDSLGTALRGHQALWKSQFKGQIIVLDAKAMYEQCTNFVFCLHNFWRWLHSFFFPSPDFHQISNSLSLMPPLPDYTLSSSDLLDAHKKEVEAGFNSKLLELMNTDSHGFHPSVRALGQLERLLQLTIHQWKKCFQVPTRLRNLHPIHKVKFISEVIWCFWNGMDGHLTDVCSFTPVDINHRIACLIRFSCSTVISIPPKHWSKEETNICYSWHPGLCCLK